MSSTLPLVSIGIPVYNGDRFLEAALDSVLNQTYPNLEIIIFDNASTDRTPEICARYAAMDRRVKYFRNDTNLGAARNYNLTLEHATGTYFKWVAHDDVCAPAFIERCVEELEHEPSAVLAYPKTIIINESGNFVEEFEDEFNFRDKDPSKRYEAFSLAPLTCNAVFGVIRTDVLRKTPAIGPFESSDRVLLGELALLGEIAEVPPRLFYRRVHPEISTYACRTKASIASWFDPNGRRHFTRLRRSCEYVRSIFRVPLSPLQRVRCLWSLMGFHRRFYLGAYRWQRLFIKLRTKLSGERLELPTYMPHRREKTA